MCYFLEKNSKNCHSIPYCPDPVFILFYTVTIFDNHTVLAVKRLIVV